MSFEMKKEYLLKRINEEYNLLHKLSINNWGALSYVLNQARDKFFYSAPEVVDECFYVLKNYILLDEDIYNNGLKDNGLGLNIYGEPIKCILCDSLEHVQINCDKFSKKSIY
jgi:hypothetical protein